MNISWLPFLGLIWLLIVLLMRRRDRARATGTDGWRDLAAGGVLFLLTVGFFWRTLAGDVFQPADGGDLVSFLFPTYRFAASELAQGRLPLWNPTLYAGAPFIGDIQAGFLYLPNLLLFLAAPEFPYTTMQWLAILHFYWAGLGMYVLLRTLRWPDAPVSRLAALFGAVAFMFCDPLLVHFGNLNLIAVLSWLPWVLAAYDRALTARSLRWAAAAGLLFALSTYAGHAQSTVYVGLALVIYAVAWCVLRVGELARPVTLGTGWRAVWPGVWTLGITVGLTLLLTAPILLPALELTRSTVRADFTYQDAIAYSVAPTQALVGLVTPGFFGRGPALHWSLWERVELPYAGVATLILAVAGLLLADQATRRRLWPWLALALFGLVVSLGVYGIVHGWLTWLLPFFNQFRAPARALILWALGISVLAAVGVDRLRALTINNLQLTINNSELLIVNCKLLIVNRFLRAGAFLLLFIAVPLAYFALLTTQSNETSFLRASLAALALVFAAVFWLATWGILRAHQAGWFGSVALGLLLIGLLYFDLAATSAYTDISPDDPTVGFQHQEIIDFLRQDPDLFRIDTRTGLEGLWQPDTAALAGLQDVGGVANPLTLGAFAQYWENTGGRDTRAYDALNVKYVLVKEGTPLPAKFEQVFGPVGGIAVYRNSTFAPRAWVALGQPDLSTLETPASPTGATVTSYTGAQIEVQVDAPEAGYLVLSEFWFPGWQATVDSAPAPVEPVAGTFRAVPVPAGVSTVRLWYWPATFQWGLLAAGIGLAIIAALILWPRRRRSAS